jgi:hypothetical protein
MLVQLIVHWEFCELVQFCALKTLDDGSVDEGNAINKMTNSFDLLSTWTASNLDTFDATWEAMSASSNNNSTSTLNKNTKKASQHCITPKETRKMKPRQLATHWKREAEYHQIAQKRTIHHESTFCSMETGGLDAMLLCAARMNDHCLRRELGLQIRRLMRVYDEKDDNEVKKLIHRELG